MARGGRPHGPWCRIHGSWSPSRSSIQVGPRRRSSHPPWSRSTGPMSVIPGDPSCMTSTRCPMDPGSSIPWTGFTAHVPSVLRTSLSHLWSREPLLRVDDDPSTGSWDSNLEAPRTSILRPIDSSCASLKFAFYKRKFRLSLEGDCGPPSEDPRSRGRVTSSPPPWDLDPIVMDPRCCVPRLRWIRSWNSPHAHERSRTCGPRVRVHGTWSLDHGPHKCDTRTRNFDL
jgi:hypothetical protein